MKAFVSAVLVSGLLVGCASNQLGGYAQFSNVENGSKSDLLISGRFYGGACSEHFAYLDFSVENPTSSWQKLNNIEFSFPFGANDQFAIIEGERLAQWKKAESIRRTQQEYNAGVGTLVVGLIGAVLIAASEDDPGSDTGKVGAVLYSGAAISSIASDVSTDVNRLEVAPSNPANYFANQQIEIPPGLTGKFWMVVSADSDAPLMGWLNASYDDNSGVRQAFKVPLGNWNTCRWQAARKDKLRELGPKMGRFPTSYTQRRKQDLNYLMSAEEAYQVRLQSKSAQVD